MYEDPLWAAVSCLVHQIRRRAQAALNGDPESGSLSVEWVWIAAALVGLAVVAAVVLRAKLRAELAKIP